MTPTYPCGPSVAGVDEVGRVGLFGPVVAGVVGMVTTAAELPG